ncbi:hypothetical protein MLD38_008937 [Melastoma candidum]|uniref:Uncharacterized protein n=1 Tax=Melastoma candidum TaxID=119954 RepID=A0ACB9RV39_9MYRT|nr:hypothetical protein MLD38_008937 [Melastoma candidum]
MSLRRSFGGSVFRAVGRGVVFCQGRCPRWFRRSPGSSRRQPHQAYLSQERLRAEAPSPAVVVCLLLPCFPALLWVWGPHVAGRVRCPFPEEVHAALYAVQRAFDSTAHPHLVKDRYGPYVDQEVMDAANGSGLLSGASSGGTDVDWIEPALHICNGSTRALQLLGMDRVFDAFHLLQTDPSIQRMVISLSSDKSVWDAVLNNEVVKELRTSCSAGELTNLSNESFGDESDQANEVNEAAAVIKWIFDHTVMKIMEVVDKMTRLVNDMFDNSTEDQESSAGGRRADRIPFEEKLRTSFLLSVVVLLVVAMTRARRA